MKDPRDNRKMSTKRDGKRSPHAKSRTVNRKRARTAKLAARGF